MIDLDRFGVEWRGPDNPICAMKPDGYWTPFHLAEAEITRLRAENERLRLALKIACDSDEDPSAGPADNTIDSEIQTLHHRIGEEIKAREFCREEMSKAMERAEKAEAELETERLRLAACGCAALGYFDGCKDEYKSASLDDVLQLRDRTKRAEAALAELRTAREEVLRTELIFRLERERDAVIARADKLRKAIEDAPHGVSCATLYPVPVGGARWGCTCWKLKALAEDSTDEGGTWSCTKCINEVLKT